MYHNYVAIVGTDLIMRAVVIKDCLNFVQAVETAILSINDNGGYERIISVTEVSPST